MKELTMYCNKCGERMVDVSTHPGKQDWICEDCGETDNVDVSIFIEESGATIDWSTATCGGCGYWEVVQPAKKGNVVGTHEMGRCRKGYLAETHPATIIAACPAYVPREVT